MAPSPQSTAEPTYMTVVCPNAVAVISTLALHDVVGVVRLGNLIVGVDDHLWDVMEYNLYHIMETSLGF